MPSPDVQRSWRRRNKTRLAAYNREYYQANKPQYNVRSKERRKQIAEEEIAKVVAGALPPGLASFNEIVDSVAKALSNKFFVRLKEKQSTRA